jgi:hypothetical protein
MRLFEVDLGSARDVLAVLQGQANRAGQSSILPFTVVMKLIRPFGLGISSPDGLIALKNKVDPAGDVIQDIDDKGNVTLNTDVQSANKQEKSTGPSVDQMAKSNSNLTPKI